MQATVPALTIVVRKCYGMGGMVPGDSRLRYKIAWPSADWGILPIEGGVEAAYRREIEASPDPDARRQELEDEFARMSNIFRTAEAFGVEEIIDPRETRTHLERFVEMAYRVLPHELADGPEVAPRRASVGDETPRARPVPSGRPPQRGPPPLAEACKVRVVRMIHVVRWLTTLAVLGLILASCSGGGGDAEPTPTTAPEARPTASTAPTATQVATPTSTTTPAPTPTASPAALPTPSASATLTRTATPATAAHPLSPEIVVVGDVAPEREAAFRTAFEGVFAFYADRFGIEAPGLQLYIGTDPEAVAAVYRDLGGSDPDALSGGSTIAVTVGETNAIFLAGPYVAAGPVPARLVAAELFLLVQSGLSSPGRSRARLVDRWIRALRRRAVPGRARDPVRGVSRTGDCVGPRPYGAP